MQEQLEFLETELQQLRTQMNIKVALITIYFPLLGPLVYSSFDFNYLDYICIATILIALLLFISLPTKILHQKVNNLNNGTYLLMLPGVFFITSTLFIIFKH